MDEIEKKPESQEWKESPVEIPDVIPLLPIRDIVIYPILATGSGLREPSAGCCAPVLTLSPWAESSWVLLTPHGQLICTRSIDKVKI